MIVLVYLINPDSTRTELQWLKSQNVYPSIEDYYDARDGKHYSRLGMIVPDDTALAIKLRNSIQLQTIYTHQ